MTGVAVVFVCTLLLLSFIQCQKKIMYFCIFTVIPIKKESPTLGHLNVTQGLSLYIIVFKLLTIIDDR